MFLGYLLSIQLEVTIFLLTEGIKKEFSFLNRLTDWTFPPNCQLIYLRQYFSMAKGKKSQISLILAGISVSGFFLAQKNFTCKTSHRQNEEMLRPFVLKGSKRLTWTRKPQKSLLLLWKMGNGHKSCHLGYSTYIIVSPYLLHVHR